MITNYINMPICQHCKKEWGRASIEIDHTSGIGHFGYGNKDELEIVCENCGEEIFKGTFNLM